MKKKNKDLILLYATLVAVIAATLIGGIFPQYAGHTVIFGDIFLNLLRMIMLPLVIVSMVVGVASLGDIRNLYTIGWKTGLSFLATTIIAAVIGLVLVNFIQPGKNFVAEDASRDLISNAGTGKQASNQWTSEEYPDLQYTLTGEGLRVVVMSGTVHKDYSNEHFIVLTDQNVVGQIESMSDISITVKFWASLAEDAVYVLSKTGEPVLFVEDSAAQIGLNPKGEGVAFKHLVVQPQSSTQNGVLHKLKALLLGDTASNRAGIIPQNLFNALVTDNLLPLMLFALFIGYALLQQGETAELVIDALHVINIVIMQFVHCVMYFAPVGIFGLVAGKIAEVGGFANLLPELIAVGKYSITVLAALFIHGAVVLPLLLWCFRHRNPITFAKGMQPALLTAFSTGSSSTTLPLTMDCVENNNGISSQVSTFVLPLGATLNMNGAAIYFTVIAVFIAQVYGIAMGPVDQLFVICVTTLLAISAGSIPGAALMSMVILMRMLHLPIAGITHIIAVDWLMERFVTLVNIWGDGVCAGMVEEGEPEGFSEALEPGVGLEEAISDSHVVT